MLKFRKIFKKKKFCCEKKVEELNKLKLEFKFRNGLPKLINYKKNKLKHLKLIFWRYILEMFKLNLKSKIGFGHEKYLIDYVFNLSSLFVFKNNFWKDFLGFFFGTTFLKGNLDLILLEQ